MSSPAFEAFLVRVMLDDGERNRFLAAPQEVARAAGLCERDIEALSSIDRAGLLMAAESLRQKRQRRTAAAAQRTRSRLLAWLRARYFK